MLPETHISTDPIVTRNSRICLLFLKISKNQTVTLLQRPESSSQPAPIEPSRLK